MTEITERAEVAGILADPRFLVPEADAPAIGPFDRFRSLVSRFANGAVHDARRERLEAMLGALDPAMLGAVAAARTRAALDAHAGFDSGTIAWHVPVATLAEGLGFEDPDAMPACVAAIVDRYASGRPTDDATEDAATELLLAASGTGDDDERVLRVQLLVQAFAATGALVERAMRRLAASAGPHPPTRELLLATLRDDSPVPLTRRIAPDGDLLVLRLDGPDGDAGPALPPRTLAFGAGARRCPAPHHALAIAAAMVDELRRDRLVAGRSASAAAPAAPPAPEEVTHADAR